MLDVGAIWSLSREGLSEQLFQKEGLESNSVLSESLVAASYSSRNINALVLKHLPFQVSDLILVCNTVNMWSWIFVLIHTA